SVSVGERQVAGRVSNVRPGRLRKHLPRPRKVSVRDIQLGQAQKDVGVGPGSGTLSVVTARLKVTGGAVLSHEQLGDGSELLVAAVDRHLIGRASAARVTLPGE